MWWGGRDAEGWKLKGGDDSTVSSLQSLTSMDGTRAGAHGLILDRASTYSPAIAEDEDKAAVNHRLVTKLGEGHVYAPSGTAGQPPPPGSRTTLRLCGSYQILCCPRYGWLDPQA
jgi:hypothetical protein